MPTDGVHLDHCYDANDDFGRKGGHFLKSLIRSSLQFQPRYTSLPLGFEHQ